MLDIEHFRARVGPFSSLEALASLHDYTVTVGPHPHCASPPQAAPDGYGNHTRIGLQPVLDDDASCLDWYTVDLFVSSTGAVEAITFDTWEP